MNKNEKKKMSSDKKKEIKQILLDIQDMLNNLQLLVSQRQEHIMEQLPKDIEKGSLHKVLGYEEDFNLADQSEDEMIRRSKEAINSGKITYKELIGKLNWQKVMNKTNNPAFSRKLDRIMDELKDWWEKKKK